MLAAILRATRMLRVAHLMRVLWLRLRRPLTMGTRAILLDRAPEGRTDRVLLIRHSYVHGWHLPGGGVDTGETLAEAVRREVREEVGLRVGAVDRLLGLYARFRHGASDHVAIFVVTDWSGTPTVDGVEIVETAFFPVNDLPPDTSPGTRRRIAEFLAGEPIPERW